MTATSRKEPSDLDKILGNSKSDTAEKSNSDKKEESSSSAPDENEDYKKRYAASVRGFQEYKEDADKKIAALEESARAKATSNASGEGEDLSTPEGWLKKIDKTTSDKVNPLATKVSALEKEAEETALDLVSDEFGTKIAEDKEVLENAKRMGVEDVISVKKKAEIYRKAWGALHAPELIQRAKLAEEQSGITHENLSSLTGSQGGGRTETEVVTLSPTEKAAYNEVLRNRPNMTIKQFKELSKELNKVSFNRE